MKSSLPFPPTLQLFLTALVGLNLLPLLTAVPIWISVLSGCALALKLLHLLRGWPTLPKKWIWVVGLVGFVFIFITKHTIFGEEASTAILFLLACCKLLETEQYRDAMITVVLCFILLAANLLLSQGLLAMAFFLIDIVLLMQFFLQLHPNNQALFSFKAVGKILAVVLPFWILLFVIFPRFSIAFWHVDRGIPMNTFGDEMSPGEISKLVQTNELAFRAQFAHAVDDFSVKPQVMYWRGGIFSYTQGLRWSKIPSGRLPLDHYESGQKGDILSYEIWLEPLFRKWAFTLDYPVPGLGISLKENHLERQAGFSVEFQRELVTRTRYSGFAHLEAPDQKLTPLEKKFYLQLPSQLEATVKDLANQLRDPRGDAEKSIAQLTAWFKSQRFFYTVAPGLISDQQGTGLDTFLFHTRKGFCEHYAAAGAVLLRAMGIPARVVVGFQGAQMNDVGGYWIVRNKNAHAWSEAYVNRRWQRMDLVSIVSPIRLELGADYFQIPNGALDHLGDSSESAFQKSWLTRAQSKTNLIWDTVEMKWIRFLTAYDFDFQQDLFSRIGLQNSSRLTFFIALFVGLLILVALAFWWLQRPQRKQDPIQKWWLSFNSQMRKKGFTRLAAEGPRDFIARLQTSPVFSEEQRQVLQQIAEIYLRLRYAPASGSGSASTSVNDLLKILRRLERLLRKSANPDNF